MPSFPNISGGFIKSEILVFISHESNARHRKSQIFAGDIVVVRTGQAGIAAIVTPDFDGAIPAIVRFLDHMDRRIGRAIRAKQKLIALLNEQKQDIIHQAVTRGLDPKDC